MRASVLIRISLQSILRNKLRTLLTMLGIIIGVASVIVMVSIGEGARRQIQDQISNLGSNMIVITAGSAHSQRGVSRGGGASNSLSLRDADKLKRESALLVNVSPVIFSRTQVVGGEGNWRAMILGVNHEYLAIRDWPLVSGLFFSAHEVRSMRKVAVLGQTVARNLFPANDALGQEIRIRNVPFQIVGVLDEKGQTAEGNDQDEVILVPYLTMQNRLKGWSFIGQILASTGSQAEIMPAQLEIRAVMRESHRLTESEEDDFTIRNQMDLATVASGTTRVMTLLLAAIASISLLVGGIGIMNIMLVSVTERTREIGIRMSIGARSRDVLTQFLVEATVISVLGGVLGVVIGFLLTPGISWITGWNTVISFEMPVVALLFAASVGVVFGLYPARKAAALNPVEALRYE